MQIKKPTLHILTDYTPFDNKIETYWRECFKDIDFDQYEVNIIEGSSLRHDSYLWSDTHFKSQQLKVILDMVTKNEIKTGDVFIFTNAWNFVAVPLSFFRYEFGLKIKMIGFWGNSLFNRQSPMWKRFKRKHKKWGRDFELALYNAYDLNCFLCDEHLKLFQNKYSGRNLRKTEFAVTGYPFEYLTRDVGLDDKEKKIVFPYDVVNEYQSQIFKGLAAELDYEFVFARKTHNNRWQYKILLKESVGMFCAAYSEYDPAMLYEGMVNGLIPFVPNRLMYQYTFPEVYQYPSMLSKPKNNKFLYIVRNRLQLMDFISEKIDNYNQWKDVVLSDAREMGEKYYSNGLFKSLLNAI